MLPRLCQILVVILLLRPFAALRGALLCSLLFAGFGVAAFAGEGRLALVVGNQAYQNVPRLANPGNDARGVSEALRKLGFEVTLLTDVNTEVFNVVVKAFAAQSKTAESVVFYYSGHAFQENGQNHLLPVSVQPDAAGTVVGQTWMLDDIVTELQASDAQTLIFLDACRTSPIAGSSGAHDGLAQMQTRAGTFISFATRPGAVSFDRDGDQGNSPYTAALLRHVSQPGQSISDLMIKVRNDVEAATDGQQTPWDQSSLRAQFYFNPVAAAPALPQFEIVQSDTIISPPPGAIAVPEAVADVEVDAAAELQVAALVVPEVGPVVQAVEAQAQSAGAAETETRAAPLPNVSAPAVAASTPVVVAPAPVAAKPVPVAPVLPNIPEDLASAVQTELKRVGCYNMRIDGDWGNGSRRALSSYLDKVENDALEELEPTADLYLTLLKEPEGICPPVVARTAPKTVRKKVVPRRAKATQKKVRRKAAAPKAKAPAKKKTKCTFLIVAIVCK